MSDSLKAPHLAAAAGLGVIAVAAIALVLRNPFVTLPAAPAKQASLVELIGMKYPLGKTIEALAAPEIGAPTLTRVRQGSEVNVVGMVEGDSWYQIELPDKRLGYVQVAAIPAAAAPAAAPQALAPPAAEAIAPPPGAGRLAQADTSSEPAADGPPMVEFDEAHDVARVTNLTAVYLRPSRLAPKAYPVDAGTQVYIVARSRDGNWAWVDTEDHAPAYMPLADVAR